MTKTFRFYKTIGDNWYIDIPEYEGDLSDLQMILGTDELLDEASNDTDEVYLKISDDEKLKTRIRFVQNTEYDKGAEYTFLGEYLWIGDIGKYIFNKFPDKIYIEIL